MLFIVAFTQYGIFRCVILKADSAEEIRQAFSKHDARVESVEPFNPLAVNEFFEQGGAL